MNIEFTDRYDAFGIQLPDPKTMCGGQCEGTGVIPVYIRQKIDNSEGIWVDSETDENLISLWMEAEKENPSNDGWHFVKCPSCNGTGRGV